MTIPCRALLLVTLILAACAPLREQRQLSVTEARTGAPISPANVLAAPTADTQSESTEEAVTPVAAGDESPKDCLVLGRAVERVDGLKVVHRDTGWQLEGEVSVADLNHERYYVRVELIGLEERLIATITTPVKGLGPAIVETERFAVGLPNPSHFETVRLGLVSEQHASERLSLWR
ncbi:MAG: hypothetical protein RL885_07525 [Planctomycetota bacterium]